MKIIAKCLLCVFIASASLVPLSAQQYPQPQAQPYPYAVPPQPYPGTQAQYYYNQNNPYSNNNPPPGFYGGFYGSPPPPTPSQAFPDKASSDALYRYIQNR